MSYTFLQDRGGASLAESFVDIEPYVRLKLIPSTEKSYYRGNEMEFCHGSQSGMMCEPSMDRHGEDSQISCAAVFPAKISAPQGEQTAKALMENRADCGSRWPGLFARWNPDLSSWRIPQLSLFVAWEKFSEIWPRWGLMHDGECFLLAMLEHDTNVKESGSWGYIGTPIKTQRSRSKEFCSGRVKRPYELCPPGWLPNPRWVERLMGWPDGWSSLTPLEMGKYRKWLHTHGGC